MKKFSKLILTIGLLVLVGVIIYRYSPFFKQTNVNISSISTLSKAIDISQLSTAEFRYRGIAEIYTDQAKTNLRCRICYNAVVKAGIDMKDVTFEIDPDSRIVTATLPEIQIRVSIVDEDSILVLPSDADVEIDTMLKVSKEDAENEASQSRELIDAARDNLKSVIEGLLFPLLKAEGYILVWN